MGFNYASEKKKFDREWARFRKDYAQAGMCEEAIREMYEFDLAVFRSKRTYANRTQRLPDILHPDANERERSRLLQKYEVLTESFEEKVINRGQSWLDTLEDPRLVKGLKQLSQDELELLMWLVQLEYSQRELARLFGCSQYAISKRYQKIKRAFK